ncbi:cyclic lactone autoinducer peptide [Paenibacillus swuensis]|nr:cyclic lactone autoinducer peptide [Paenibacillus swuensis]
MKHFIAKYSSLALMAVGTFFVFTNSYCFNRPETPTELLKK